MSDETDQIDGQGEPLADQGEEFEVVESEPVYESPPDLPGQRPTWVSTHVPTELLAELFVFKLKLTNGTTMVVNMVNDLEVDYERLEEQIDQCPGQYVWWASIYSEAKSMVSLLERRIKIRRGQLTEKMVYQLREGGLTKVTDKQVAAVIEKDDILIAWEVKLIVLQRNTGKLWHMLQAIQMKSEHLRSRAGFKRQEMQQQR